MVVNRLRKSSSTPSSSPGKPSLNGRNYYYYNCKPVIPTVDRNVSSCSREMRPGSNNGWLLKPACLLSLLDVWEESLRCPLGTTIREGVGQAVSYCVCHVSAHCESLRGCFDASSSEYWVPRFQQSIFLSFSPESPLTLGHHSLWPRRRRSTGGCRCRFFMILSAGRNNWLCV